MPSAYVVNPCICWIGFRVNLYGSDAKTLQIYS